MEQFIQNCYNEYLQFMGLNATCMPRIESIIVNETGKLSSLAYVNMDTINEDVAHIYYNNQMQNYLINFQKAKLFHEFTHILHHLNFYKKYDEKHTIAIMNLFSEYNASQIELRCNLGFKNMRSLSRINLDNTYVSYENKKHKISDDYIHPLSDALVIIGKAHDTYFDYDIDDYYAIYKKFESNSMYYLGKRDLCAVLSNRPIPDLTGKQYGTFANEINNIRQIIKQKDYADLYDAYKKLLYKFVAEFPNKEQEVLLGQLH